MWNVWMCEIIEAVAAWGHPKLMTENLRRSFSSSKFEFLISEEHCKSFFKLLSYWLQIDKERQQLMNKASKSFKIICDCFQTRWKLEFMLILCLFCTTIWRDFMKVKKKTKKPQKISLPEIQETEFTYWNRTEPVPIELKITFLWKDLSVILQK